MPFDEVCGGSRTAGAAHLLLNLAKAGRDALIAGDCEHGFAQGGRRGVLARQIPADT